METLSERIITIEAKMAENEELLLTKKEAYNEEVKVIKDENKRLTKIAKKLKDTEATIESIFNSI